MIFRVFVNFKPGILDPEAEAIKKTLKNMGYQNISDIRQGKYFEIEINESNKEKAKKTMEEICKKLLSNTMIEDYSINLE